ncbi:hypothetical protein [Vampirovibrio sp.]|uniref:hypothetical protein n=1 Tax=Vampirovibrio sp. TaxID=2717857 RepID=UPI0035934FD6
MFRNPIRLTLACLLSVVALQSSDAFAYQLDAKSRTLSVTPGTSASATTTDLKNAFNYLVNRSDKTSLWTLKLAPGNYYVLSQIPVRNLQNTALLSDMSQPAKLIKDKSFTSASGGEYLLNFQFSKNISITGMQFYGQTDFAKSLAPVWPDQGVYFGSCNTVNVKNNAFYNFGNGALRVTTTERDPVIGVNSFNTVVANNLFNNVYQVTTTPNDDVHGGSANFTLQSNVFYNLRGSIKFASRTAGAKNVKILSNKINGGDHYGLEVNNYDDMEIRGNTIQNMKEFAINIYNNPRATSTFNWGNNFVIADNNISNVGRGIRFSTEPYANGTQVLPRNVSFINNTMNGVKDTSGLAAISQINGKVNGLTITGNKLSNIANKKYINYSTASTSVKYYNNLVNGVAFGPQQSTASK